MNFETFPALVTLALGTLFTPGPNNAMLAASGANFGFCRTVPHALGVALEFPLMVMIVGLMLGELFQASVLLRDGLRYGGAALLLWIAWRTANSAGTGSKRGGSRPMRFVAAAGFQWINPKAWSMAVAATSQFITPENPISTAGQVTATFLTFGLVSSATWAFAGQAISGWLTTKRRLRAFNVTMAGLIVLSSAQLLAT